MTSNPMLRPRAIESALELDKPMTVQGAVNKTLLFLIIGVASAAYTWIMCAKGFSVQKTFMLSGVASIMGLILAVITSFKPQAAKITGGAFAICEGVVMGAMSLYSHVIVHNGIVLQAIGITLLALFSMLFLYTTSIIKATETFRKVVTVSTMAIMSYYLITFVMSWLGHSVTLFNGGLIGIAVSLIFCTVASLNFILDFDFVEKGAQAGAPSYYEWYGALTLMVTIVWLYLEVLRLLAQIYYRRS